MSDLSTVKTSGQEIHSALPKTDKAGESTAYQYDAFISYSSKIDYATARKVESFLESFHKTPAPAGASIRRLQICRDGSDFKLPRKRTDAQADMDDPIWDIIHAELSKCRYLIVLCSPAGVASTWMSKEISWFLKERGRESILPVITAGAEPIGKPEECFPAEIVAENLHTGRIWYDLRGLNKQLGAEKVRDYEDEMVRLASDLLAWDTNQYGPLATIWERDQLKTRRRQATISLIAAVVMIAVSGVAFWQFEIARQKANMARANAALMAVSSSVEDPVAAALVIADVAELTQRTAPPGGVNTAVQLTTVPTAYSILRGHQDPITSAAFSPDGRSLVTSSYDKTVRVWRADGTGLPVVLQGHHSTVWSAAFSPDGRSVVTASDDKTARVWRADGSGSPVVLQGHHSTVGSAAFSPDGRSVVTASDDETARVWRADGTGSPVVLRGHQNIVRTAAFSPDGRSVVTASDDKTARVWRADGTGSPVLLQGHQNIVTSAAFSPDGQRVVTASYDKTARVWRADGTGSPMVLQGHQDIVTSAAFSPDGRSVVTASDDKTARVWRADGTGSPVVLQGHQNIVTRAAFSPDGRSVVTASDDKTARVWLVEWQTLVEHLKRSTNACLEPDQRIRFLGETGSQAKEAYESCERKYERLPEVPCSSLFDPRTLLKRCKEIIT